MGDASNYKHKIHQTRRQDSQVITVIIAADILGALVSPERGAAEAPPKRTHDVHFPLLLSDHPDR